MRLSKNQKTCLEFYALKVGKGQIHGFAYNSSTVPVVRALVNKGLLAVNWETRQAIVTGKGLQEVGRV